MIIAAPCIALYLYIYIFTIYCSHLEACLIIIYIYIYLSLYISSLWSTKTRRPHLTVAQDAPGDAELPGLPEQQLLVHRGRAHGEGAGVGSQHHRHDALLAATGALGYGFCLSLSRWKYDGAASWPTPSWKVQTPIYTSSSIGASLYEPYPFLRVNLLASTSGKGMNKCHKYNVYSRYIYTYVYIFVYMYMYIIPQSLLLHYFTYVSVVSQVGRVKMLSRLGMANTPCLA